jgi:very-short-patch-repair endonuclease
VGRETDTYRPQIGPPLDGAVAELAARQHGVVALAQLGALGLGPRGVRHRAAAGRLHRLHRGVYAVGHAHVSVQGRRLAAVFACGTNAVVSHRTAADLWGIRGSDSRLIDVTVSPRTGRRAPAGVRLHRVRRLSPDDVTRHEEIPVTTVARTLVDLADALPADALAKAVNETEVRRLLDVTAVEEAIARANGRRGAANLHLLTDSVLQPTRSPLEERFLSLLREWGLPEPRVNAPVTVGGRNFEVDALWPRERLIVELDGAAFHHTRRAFHADRERDLALATQGYLVVRLTWRALSREPDRVARQLRELLTIRA